MAKNVVAIVLAAGKSERMGAFKPLLPYDESTVVESVVDALLECPLCGVWVVLGHRGEEIRQALDDRPVECVLNSNYEEGMLTSVQCGVGIIPDEAEGFLICLGDQPWLRKEIVQALLDAFETGEWGIVVPTHSGKRGHPVLIASRYRDEILDMEESVGLRQLLWEHREDVLEVSIEEESILQDLDMPEDYRRVLGEEG